MNDNNPVQPTLLRLKHIIGDKTHPPIIPLSRSAWRQGVKDGNAPHLSRLERGLQYGVQMICCFRLEKKTDLFLANQCFSSCP